jgi:hypothetical protein
MPITEKHKTREPLNLDNAFKAESQNIEAATKELAEHIAIEDDAVSQLEAEFKDRKERLKEAKTKLAEILIQAGMESVKLSSGLSPKVKIKRRFYQQQGITEEDLFNWLRKNQLGTIIKPHVNFNTLQATIKEYELQGNIVDDIFTISNEPTVTMYGKSKFLDSKQQT